MPRGVVRHWPPAAPVRPASPCAARVAARCEKTAGSDHRPTGQLTPRPAELSWASLALAACESRARRGESLVLYEDAPILWRFALPRAGWGPGQAQRDRLPPRPLSRHHIRRAAPRKRQAWGRSRRWRRVPSGVWLSVLGAVHDGTAQVCSPVVPQLATEGWRPSSHPRMALLGHTGKNGVMVVARRGLHRAPQLASTRAHWRAQCRWPGFPAPGDHPRHPMEGFWRVLKDWSGAGRCVLDLHQLYQRTRRGLMAHQEQPISAFHWSQIPPQTQWELLAASSIHRSASFFRRFHVSPRVRRVLTRHF
jgi:hypothetical protein